MSILSIGDEIRPGTYQLHSRFRRAINFADGGRLVSLVAPEIGPGPVNLVMSTLPDGEHWTGTAKLCVSESLEQLALGPLCFDLSRAERYDSRLPSGLDAARLRQNLPFLRDAIERDAPSDSLAFLIDPGRRNHFQGAFAAGWLRQVDEAVRQIFFGDLIAGIGGLKGCGVGLTPSGDDFIAGLLVALHVMAMLGAQANAGAQSVEQCGEDRGRPLIEDILRAARGDSIFSNTLLDLARRGRVFPSTKALLTALGAADAEAVRAAAKAAFAVGATSGADFAVGLFMTLVQEPRFGDF